MTDTLKTVQALVEALEDIADCGAEAWGEHRNCNKQARAALTAGRALIAQMQRDAVQPAHVFNCWQCGAPDPYAASEAQALDSARPVTEQEDRVLRNAALRSSTLVAKGKLVDSQLQQPRCRYCNGSGAIEKFACHDCDGTGKARGISYAESELQQPDGHSTRASGVRAFTTPPNEGTPG